MAKTNNRMLMPDDDDLEPIEIDQTEKKRWIRGEDKLPAVAPVGPPPAPEPPPVTRKQILLSVDSDLLDLYGKAAKKKRMTRTAWINQACIAELERENIQ